jgi:hypothetical protein
MSEIFNFRSKFIEFDIRKVLRNIIGNYFCQQALYKEYLDLAPPSKNQEDNSECDLEYLLKVL